VKPAIPIALIVVFTAGMLLGWEIGVAIGRPDMAPVLVAAIDLPAGTSLDQARTQLAIQFRPVNTLPEDLPMARVVADQLLIKTLPNLRDKVIARSIAQGEPVRAQDIQPRPGLVTTPSGCLFTPAPRGSRAVTIRVPVEEVERVRSGARVDLFHTRIDPVSGKLTTSILNENVLVLGVRLRKGLPRERDCPWETLTLAVGPIDLGDIVWANDTGTISVALRESGDTTVVNPPSFSGAAIPSSPRLQREPPLRVIESWKPAPDITGAAQTSGLSAGRYPAFREEAP
jgi:Flp pilus assembly protein CpaB